MFRNRQVERLTSVLLGSLVALSSTTAAHAAPGFYVEGRHLYDKCGEQTILRGVNEMVVWSPNQDGTPFFSEIARTGANVVRIVWDTSGSVSNLERAIENAIANQLIPMPELHDATGDLWGVSGIVDWWTRNDVAQMLQRHEEYLLVNIANEAGDHSTQQSDFESTYRDAITRMRAAGIAVPLIIDGSSWGQDIDMLQAAGPNLIAHDPEGNIMLSVHMWWADASGSRVRSELDESVNAGLPLIVGEFAQHAVEGCDQNPFAYDVLLSEAERLQVGWLAWSWGGVNNGDCSNQGSFDMTTNGMFGSWETGWGQEVSVTNPNSIQNTSVRPGFMVTGNCPTASCSDGLQNQDETDVDCGGATCPQCPDGDDCTQASDCVSGLCEAGTCGCAGGLTACAGACVDTATDAAHCGSCDAPCALPGATSVCTGGSCEIESCQAGFHDLDALPANGCEYACTPTGGETCNGQDDDCNGETDEAPECGQTPGSGGTPGAGGAGSGGTPGVGGAGIGGATGVGGAGIGGTTGVGGFTGVGGTAGTGTGGTPGTGGAAIGGAPGVGGHIGVGGTTQGTGGSIGAGGTSNTGGSSLPNPPGASGLGAGGESLDAGAFAQGAGDEEGCGCSTPGSTRRVPAWLGLTLLGVLWVLRRRREPGCWR